MDRLRVLQAVLWVYVIGSLIGCLALVSGRVGNVDDVHLAATTTGKILGLGSLLALGYGGFRAALDPLRNKVMIQVLILFTSLAALALLYRLFVEDHEHSVTTWLLLIPAIAGPVLMAVFYPYRESDEERHSDSGSPTQTGRRTTTPRADSAAPITSAPSRSAGDPGGHSRDEADRPPAVGG